MRNFARIFLVLLITIGVVFAMYFEADNVVKSNKSAGAITETKHAVTEIAGDKIPILESEEQNYSLFRQDDKVVFTHNGIEHIFTNRSKYIDMEKPTVLIKNIDEDSEEEVIIRVVGDVDGNGNPVHHVYVLNEVKDNDLKLTYHVTALTQNTVDYLITNRVISELSQLPNCKKTAVFAMCMFYQSINYNRETGRPGGYYGIFRALQDKDGNYLTINKWSAGAGDFVIEDERIFMYIPITVYYKESSVSQNAGYMKCEVCVDSKKKEYISGYLNFISNEEYGLYPFSSDAKENWNCTIKNSSKAVSNDKLIDYISYETSFENTDIATEDFSKTNSDMNKISMIYATESYVELTAKKGCYFSKELADTYKFGVFASAIRRADGGSRNYDIAYTASIKTDKSGNQVLHIDYDKTYDKKYMSTVNIKFGV